MADINMRQAVSWPDWDAVYRALTLSVSDMARPSVPVQPPPASTEHVTEQHTPNCPAHEAPVGQRAKRQTHRPHVTVQTTHANTSTTTVLCWCRRYQDQDRAIQSRIYASLCSEPISSGAQRSHIADAARNRALHQPSAYRHQRGPMPRRSHLGL
jgi:hypothetical protein